MSGVSYRVAFGLCAVIGLTASSGPSSAESRLFSARTDQPDVTIVEAVQNGKDLPVAGQNAGATFFRIDNPAGAVPCVNSIRFVGSNGQAVVAAVDLCANNWQLTIAVGSAAASGAPPAAASPPPSGARPPATIQPLPPTPSPPLTQLPPPQQPPLTSDQATAPAMQWTFAATATQASLAYGAPDNSATELGATCQPASGRATLVLDRSAGNPGSAGKVWVTFTAGAFSKAYSATVGTDGQTGPQLTLLVSDPLWASLIKESSALVAIGSTPAYGLSLAGSATPVREFLAACSPAPPPQVVQAPPAMVSPQQAPSGAVDVPFLCDDGSYISATFGRANAIVYEPGYPPLALPEVPFNGDGRRFALGPSQLVGEGEQVYWTRDGGDERTCRRGG